MASEVPIEQWADRLEAVVSPGRGPGPLRRVRVVRETQSSQDAARRMDAQPGDVVVAWRQTAGRGRLGRAWADPDQEGVAASFVVDARPGERLALASAVAAAATAETLTGRRAGIKWPNDVVVDGRKLCGILIEVAGGRAVIGIGMNVRQTSWPEALAKRAVSLAQLGAAAGRLEVLETLLASMNETLVLDDERLAAEFAARDVLAGRRVTFRSGDRVVTGTVLRIDPLNGLLIGTEDGGREYLDAATTSLAQDSPSL